MEKKVKTNKVKKEKVKKEKKTEMIGNANSGTNEDQNLKPFQYFFYY